ncbi:hypothetical protein SE18_17520 [Herpetosiphon geysericola]|uniref:Uncharacterized protein n=1 Tax=Herpetosiphon geysericola TaxID=70996 RepID=A0A0P6XZE4_9CHLR|nr:hypothetical protein SE18_17520 [Herpetosiphon geysericola]
MKVQVKNQKSKVRIMKDEGTSQNQKSKVRITRDEKPIATSPKPRALLNTEAQSMDGEWLLHDQALKCR